MFCADDGSELGLRVVGAANDALLGELLHDGDELVGDFVFNDAHGQGHATHAGAAKGRVDDAGRGALERGVGEHEAVVLGFGLSLHALAVGGGDGVDMLADVRGAHEAHAAHQRMGHQDLGLDPAAGHDVDDALGQPGLLKQLEQTGGGGRHHAGGFKHEGVAGDDAQRDHPAEGDHGREVEGGDTREHAQRLAVTHGVVPGGHVHERLALGDHGSGDGDLAPFDDLDDLAPSFIEVLAHLTRADVSELFHVLFEQGFPLEHNLGALLDGQCGPGLERLVGGLYRRFDLGCGAAGGLREDLARTRVGDLHILAGARRAPLAVNAVVKGFHVCLGHLVSSHIRVHDCFRC